MPPGVCDEVKNVDIDKLSFLQAVEDVSECTKILFCLLSLIYIELSLQVAYQHSGTQPRGRRTAVCEQEHELVSLLTYQLIFELTFSDQLQKAIVKQGDESIPKVLDGFAKGTLMIFDYTP